MEKISTIASLPSALAQSGIDLPTFRSDTLSIEELTGWTVRRLHLLPGSGVPELPGIELPDTVGACRGTGPAALCLGPREWLILEDRETPEARAGNIRAGDQPCWTDLSEGMAVFRLEGAGAPWLLNKLSCLDFQSCHGAETHCARTRMGQIAVVVHFHRSADGAERFDLLVERSFARYLWELLCASAPHADDLARARGVAA